MREPVCLDTRDRVRVVRADEELLRLRPVEDLVQHLAVARANIELELRPAAEPAPADEPAAVVPEARLGLAVRDARRPPGDLAVRAASVGPQLLRQPENRLEVGKEFVRAHDVQ